MRIQLYSKILFQMLHNNNDNGMLFKFYGRQEADVNAGKFAVGKKTAGNQTSKMCGKGQSQNRQWSS